MARQSAGNGLAPADYHAFLAACVSRSRPGKSA